MDNSLQTHQLVRRSMALVLAGGRGSRLKQLTNRRAKPAVYFGGKFRIVDFALSNCLNSGIRRMAVLTQYKSHSLLRHLQRGWSFLRPELNEMVDLLPAQQRVDEEHWYRGTADAIFQNLDIVRSNRPDYVVVLAGDHIYKMDYSLMIKDHAEQGLGCTVGCIEVPREEASAVGVMAVDEARRIHAFVEADQRNPYSSRDFGKDVIPRAVAEGQALAHPFGMSCVPRIEGTTPYWRDVGTIDAFWSANLDLAAITPELDIYDTEWPIWTYQQQLPPAKFVPDRDGRHGFTTNTIVSGGCIVSGSQVTNSVLFSSVRVHSYCEIDQAVILPDVTIGRGARLKKVVIVRRCHIPEGLVVGEDPAEDARRFERTDSGVVLITREMLPPPP